MLQTTHAHEKDGVDTETFAKVNHEKAVPARFVAQSFSNNEIWIFCRSKRDSSSGKTSVDRNVCMMELKYWSIYQN